MSGRASGGPVWPGQAFVVGEEGPEVFVPRGHGTILPNGALNGAAGRPVTVVFNVSARDAASFRRSEGQMAADAKARYRAR